MSFDFDRDILYGWSWKGRRLHDMEADKIEEWARTVRSPNPRKARILDAVARAARESAAADRNGDARGAYVLGTEPDVQEALRDVLG